MATDSWAKVQAKIVDVELNLAENKAPEEWINLRLLFVRGNARDCKTASSFLHFQHQLFQSNKSVDILKTSKIENTSGKF